MEDINQKLRKQLLKSEDTIFKQILYRKVSTRLTLLLIDSNIKPNQLSFLGLIIGFTTAVFFSFGNYVNSLLAVLFYNVYMVIDCMDGELARARNISTKFGQVLDNFSDRFVESFVFAGISVGAYLTKNDPVFLIYGIFSVLHYLLFSFVSEIAYSFNKMRIPKIRISKHLYLGSHSIIIFVITLSTIFNFLWFLIEIIALFGWIFWLVQLIRMYYYFKES